MKAKEVDHGSGTKGRDGVENHAGDSEEEEEEEEDDEESKR